MKNYIFLVLFCLNFFTTHAQESIKATSQFPLNATYQIDNSWPTGYQVTVTLRNNTANPTTTWLSTFALGQGQSVSSLWNGVLKSNSSTITVANPTWTGGGIIPANGSTTFGFIVKNPQSSTPVINNLQATANGSSSPTLPVPNAPTLNSISVSTTNPSTYTVSWNNVANATAYILQQSNTNNFANPVVVAQGSMLSQTFTNQTNGTYFYRVSASNATGTSPLSNTQSVVINVNVPPTQSNQRIESYWESWNSADPISAIVNMHVDIINISFANFATTGNHTYAMAGVEASTSTIAQLVTLAHSAGKKVKVAIGGATYPLAPQLQTTQDAIGMAQAVATYVQQNNLDGVDFDIEDYPAPALQIALIQNTRQLLGNKLVSYTPKSPASTTFPYDQVIQGAYQYLDAILIMAYDYGPGYHYQQDVANLIAMGVPASKISVGLMPGYDDLGVMTSLADITTAAHYAQQNGLQGIMFWDLNRDLENLTGLGASAATNTAWNIFHS